MITTCSNEGTFTLPFYLSRDAIAEMNDIKSLIDNSISRRSKTHDIGVSAPIFPTQELSDIGLSIIASSYSKYWNVKLHKNLLNFSAKSHLGTTDSMLSDSCLYLAAIGRSDCCYDVFCKAYAQIFQSIELFNQSDKNSSQRKREACDHEVYVSVCCSSHVGECWQNTSSDIAFALREAYWAYQIKPITVQSGLARFTFQFPAWGEERT